MVTAKERIDYIKKDKEQRDQIAKLQLQYKQLEEKYDAMTKDRDYWENKWRELQKGALGYGLNEQGYVIMAFNVPNDFYTTYPQEIDVNVINTPLYQQFPYYKIKNGEIYIDTENYKKYLGGIA